MNWGLIILPGLLEKLWADVPLLLLPLLCLYAGMSVSVPD